MALVVVSAASPRVAAIPPQSSTSGIEGVVQDDAGKGLPGVTVYLEQAGSERSAAKTDNDGRFSFQSQPNGTYVVRAVDEQSHRSAAKSIVPENEGPPAKLVLTLTADGKNSTTPSDFKFDEKADFAVAGITDWTAAGGHGSDSNLRASEALARDTRELGTGKPTAESGIHAISQSEAQLRAALTRAPDRFEANHQLGAYYLHSQRERDALPFLEKANQIDPSNYANSYDLALAYARTNNVAASRKQIHKLQAGQDSGELHRLLGDLDEQANDPLTAVREYEHAVQLDPSEQNYFAWGTELLIHRAVEPAIEVFTKGSQRYPRSERMLAGLGAALYAHGAYDAAGEKLCAASELQPSDVTPYLFLGRMQAAAPQSLACVPEALRRFQRNQPENALANYYLAISLSRSEQNGGKEEKSQEVESLLSKAVSIDSKFAEGYLELGNVYAARGDLAKAESAYNNAIACDANIAEAHFRLGTMYRRMGQPAKAREEFQTYDRLRKNEAAEIEQQRRAVRQFLIVYKDQLQNSPSQP